MRASTTPSPRGAIVAKARPQAARTPGSGSCLSVASRTGTASPESGPRTSRAVAASQRPFFSRLDSTESSRGTAGLAFTPRALNAAIP